MPRIKDVTGRRFGRLVVVGITSQRYHRHVVWRCRCDCGKETLVPSLSLLNGDTRSCGCLHSDVKRADMRTRNWKGGKRIRDRGYIQIFSPDHPHASVDGYVYEHRLIIEKKLGRYLDPDEIVHHEDRNTSNNDPANLRLFPNHSAHRRHHETLKNNG